MKLMDLVKKWRERILLLRDAADEEEDAAVQEDLNAEADELEICSDQLEAALREQAKQFEDARLDQVQVANTFPADTYNRGVATGCARQLRWCARDLLATTEGGDGE